MQRSHITEGAVVRLHSKPYRISHRTKLGGWALINRDTHCVETYPERQLYDFYAFGALKFEKGHEEASPSSEPAQPTLPTYETKIPPAHQDHSPKEQERITF